MKYPNLRQEKKLWKNGYKIVVGLDEAGRGALAGPVVAAAVAINPRHSSRIRKTGNSKQARNSNTKNLDFRHRISDFGFRISEMRDSKQLSAKKREELYRIITKHPCIQWGIAKVSEKVIDRINILEATKLAMTKALVNLLKKTSPKAKIETKTRSNEKPTIVGKWSKCDDRRFFVKLDILNNLQNNLPDNLKTGKVCHLILDGNFKLNLSLSQKSIVKGDEKVFSCAAASIIAKVTRDRIMACYHKKYPRYRFDLHKGYGTKLHFKMLKKRGPSDLHRKTFSPVSNYS